VHRNPAGLASPVDVSRFLCPRIGVLPHKVVDEADLTARLTGPRHRPGGQTPARPGQQCPLLGSIVGARLDSYRSHKITNGIFRPRPANPLDRPVSKPVLAWSAC